MIPLDKNIKKILFAGGIIVAGILVLQIIKKKKNVVVLPNQNPNPNPNPNPQLSQADITKAKKIANDVFEGMNTCGTNEGKILTALALINSNAMFDEVVFQYGTRTISSEWYCIGVSDVTGDLSTCLRAELSDDYINQINGTLATNGVTKTI